MLGNIPYKKMYEFKPSFTPVFAMLFYSVINYVMINILVSILHFQYGKAKRASMSVAPGSSMRQWRDSVQAWGGARCPPPSNPMDACIKHSAQHAPFVLPLFWKQTLVGF